MNNQPYCRALSPVSWGQRVLHWQTKRRLLDCGILVNFSSIAHKRSVGWPFRRTLVNTGIKPKAESPVVQSFGSVCLGFQGPQIILSGFLVLQGVCVTQRWPYASVNIEGGGAIHYMCYILINKPAIRCHWAQWAVIKKKKSSNVSVETGLKHIMKPCSTVKQNNNTREERNFLKPPVKRRSLAASWNMFRREPCCRVSLHQGGRPRRNQPYVGGPSKLWVWTWKRKVDVRRIRSDTVWSHHKLMS